HYYLVDKDLLYEEGRVYCESAGLGKMALIHSAQHSLVAQHVLDGRNAFVGGKIEPPESNTWDNGMWLDYSPISTWVDWSENLQPETDKVIYMLKEGGWEDKKFSEKKRILCQKIYECNGVPSNVAHATRTFSTMNTYSDTYEYRCDIGYRIDASNNDFQYIRCRGGVWQSPKPCYLKDCGTPPSDSNAVVTYTNTTYGSSVNYMCHLGYSTFGSISINISCLDTSLWEPYISCGPLSCGPPPLDYMSTVDSDGTSISDISNVPEALTLYDAHLTYTCKVGYGINGSADILLESIRCMADGNWQTHIYCSHWHCGLPDVDNNATQFGLADYYFSKVRFVCLPGYLTGGDGGLTSYTITCDVNATWGSHTPCLKTSCPGAYDMDSNAIITVYGNLFGDIVRYTCHPGYGLSGLNIQSEDIYCLANRTWSSHILCERRYCGYPADDDNAAYSFIAGWYGDNITYTCHSGYRLGINQIVSEDVICQEDGTWSVHQQCYKLSCGEPWFDPYATMNTTDPDYLFEADVTYNCVNGYGIGYNGLSTETITCLDTGDWSHHTHCVRTPCNIPPADTNANITYLSTSYSDVANYTCNLGYRLFGNGSKMESIVCGADGNWSPHAPCLEVSCGTPVDDPLANVSWTSELYLSIARYDCLYGYVTLNGATYEITSCSAFGNWSIHTPCTKISCGLPVIDPNSISTASNNSNLYGSNVTYMCNHGFRIGDETNYTFDVITCQGNGSWSIHTPCQRISCGTPPKDYNSVLYASDNLFESVTRYSCNTGFYIGNTSNQYENITCQGNGTWSSHTSCEKVPCGISLPDPNAVLTTGDNLYGSNTTYTCNDGYLIAGTDDLQEIISCQADGTWTNHIGCQRVTCGSPVIDENSLMTPSDNLYESNVTYTCNTGYLIGGDMASQIETITCLKNGSWTDHTVCLPISCGIPPIDDFSTLTQSNNLFESNVTYTCHPGYLIVGFNQSQDTITCQSDGNWTSHIPCQRLSCGDPISDPNAAIVSTDSLFESTITYICNAGYLVGGNTNSSETITCQEDGRWSIHTMCLPRSCGTPIIDVHSNMTTNENLYGLNVTYTCDTGYLIGGNLTKKEMIFCDFDGNWTNHSFCEKLLCGQPPIDDNANTTVGDNRFGSVVTYTCLEGHILNGTSTIEENATCNSDGDWTAHTPCVPGLCGGINISQNVTVTVDSMFYTDTAHFSCSIGYVSLSSGSSSGTVTCLSNGTWSDDIQCVPVSCGPPPIDLNSTVTYADTVYNSVAIYECHSGFQTQGSSNDSIICQSDATWSSRVNCTHVFCGPHPSDPYADSLLINNSITDEAIYTCKPGTALSNGAVSNNSTCLVNNTWSSRDRCYPINCNNPPEDVNANTSRSFSEGLHLVTYTCIKNFYIGGTGNDSETISCSNSEGWTIHTPCSLADCGPWPVDLRASAIKSSGTLLYAVVDFKCHEGYTLTGREDGPKYKTSTCLPTRQWMAIPYCKAAKERSYKRARKIEFPPEEAEYAVVLGGSSLVIAISFVAFIVIMDTPALFKDMRDKMCRSLKTQITQHR
ncbi:unnamed protein product, partial [Owenia fusiformis]